MALYLICTLGIETEPLSKSYQPFLLSDDKYLDKIDLSIKQTDEFHFSKKGLIKKSELTSITIWKDASPGNNSPRWIYKAINGICALSVDANYTNAVFWHSNLLDFFSKKDQAEIFSQYYQLLLQCKLLQYGFSILHSACVEINGIAYAFTGPSGIGKSSRAQKWCELLSAKWISGDRPAIDCNKELSMESHGMGKKPYIGISNALWVEYLN